MHLETVFHNIPNGGQDTLFGYIVKESVVNGNFIPFAYTDQVDNLKGHFKCNMIGDDTAFVIIQLFNSGVMFGSTLFPFTGTTSSWTEFNAPISGGNLMIQTQFSLVLQVQIFKILLW